MDIGFSVCIPVRNEACWIGRAVESVLAQTHQRFELVIGDNASDDALWAAVARFDDPRIRYVRFDDPVLVNESFNRTVALAGCDWVVPLSADDAMRPHALERLASLIEAHEADGVSMAVGRVSRVDAEGQPCDITAPGAGSRRPIGFMRFEDGLHDAASWFVSCVAPGVPPFMPGSIAYRRRVLVESGFFRTDMALVADGELCLRMAAYGPVAFTNEVLTEYTVRGDSMSNRYVRSDLERGDQTTMDERAMLSALRTHREHREVAPEEDWAVRAAAARKLLQRAVWHRRLEGGRGRYAAMHDLSRAFRYDPRALASPVRTAALLAVILAPRAWIDRASDLAHQFGITLA